MSTENAAYGGDEINKIIFNENYGWPIASYGEKYTVKKITVIPGGSLSLQSHEHRSEHWVIAQGTAEVIINDNTHIIKENHHIFIPKGSKHRLTNKNNETLIVIEMWYGEILDESDIKRYEDIYDRM